MVDIILVDENDKHIGLIEKMKAHEEWLLHRAFSVYVINDKKEVLLQQRALHKYHSPGLFCNTCCSHQFDGEDNLVAAHRRLGEEMWFDTKLEKISEFVYKTDVPTNLIEHEYLHVFLGKYDDQEIKPNPDEANSYKRYRFEDLDRLVEMDDDTIAPWTKVTWKKIRSEIENY